MLTVHSSTLFPLDVNCLKDTKIKVQIIVDKTMNLGQTGHALIHLAINLVLRKKLYPDQNMSLHGLTTISS